MRAARVFLLSAPAFALGAVFFVYPLLQILWEVIPGSGIVAGRGDERVESWQPVFRVFSFTLVQAFFSAALAAVIGVAGALLAGGWPQGVRRVVAGLSAVCFAFPPLLFVLSFFQFWQWFGGPFFGWPAVLLGHAFFNFGLFYRETRRALEAGGEAQGMVALSLGATRLRALCSVVLPELLPSLAGSFLLAYLYCAGSFLVVLILGGGPQFSTLEVAIYQAVKMDFAPSRAALYAGLQVGVFLLLAVPYSFLVSSLDRVPRARWLAPQWLRVRSPVVRAGVNLLFGAVLFVLVLGPIGALIASGVFNIVAAWHADAVSALRTSLVLATAVACLTGLVAGGLLLAFRATERPWQRKFLAGMPLVTLAVSPVVLGLGLWLGFAEGTGNSLWWVAGIQSLFALPLASRPLFAASAQMDGRLLVAASSLGASAWYRWRQVQWPHFRAAAVCAVLYAFLFSLSEVASQMILVGGTHPTLLLFIYDKMGHYGFAEAAGLSVILLAVMAVAVVLLRWFEEKT